jgi:hypothetical protein
MLSQLGTMWRAVLLGGYVPSQEGDQSIQVIQLLWQLFDVVVGQVQLCQVHSLQQETPCCFTLMSHNLCIWAVLIGNMPLGKHMCAMRITTMCCCRCFTSRATNRVTGRGGCARA